MNACLRCSPRQGKSEAAKRLIFSRRWEGFGSRNQPPLRENALLAGVPADMATSHPRSKNCKPHKGHQATGHVETTTDRRGKRKAPTAEASIDAHHHYAPRAGGLRAFRGSTNGGRP